MKEFAAWGLLFVLSAIMVLIPMFALQACKEQRNTPTPPHRYIVTQDHVRYYGSRVLLFDTYVKLYTGNKETAFFGTFVVEEQ